MAGIPEGAVVRRRAYELKSSLPHRGGQQKVISNVVSNALKALTAAPAGTAAPTRPATALASPGAPRTELIRVFYAVLYPYIQAKCSATMQQL